MWRTAEAVLDLMGAARTVLPSSLGSAQLLGAEHPMKRLLHHRWRQLADVLDALSPHSREKLLASVGERVLDVNPSSPDLLRKPYLRQRGEVGTLAEVHRRFALVEYPKQLWRVPLEHLLLSSSVQFETLRAQLAEFFADYRSSVAPRKRRRRTRRPSTQPRDSQRSKLYRMEEEFLQPVMLRVEPRLSLAECGELVQHVTDQCRPWLQVRVAVKDGRGSPHGRFVAARATIQLPGWARTRSVVLHEVAHAVVAAAYPEHLVPVAAHGPEFVGVFFALLERFAEVSQALLLAEAVRRGVRVTVLASFDAFLEERHAYLVQAGIASPRGRAVASVGR